MKVLLAVTGSVAATLTPSLVEELQKRNNEVQVIATDASLYFYKATDVNVPVWTDKDEWKNNEYQREDSILHIELRNWADALLIAPLSANTLAKMANGFCDNALTSVIRAWDRSKSIIIAPAMNTKMWEHPATEKHLNNLKQWYKLTVVPPITKKLACGDNGIGAMATIDSIIKQL